MKIEWKPKANNFWLGKLKESTKLQLKNFDGTYNDSEFMDIGYVCRVGEHFAVRFYGSLYSGTHPIERCEYATKEDAMASAERHATAILAAKILSR
jgi:hypothetical protein